MKLCLPVFKNKKEISFDYETSSTTNVKLPNLTNSPFYLNYPNNVNVIYKVENLAQYSINVASCGFNVIYGGLQVDCNLGFLEDILEPKSFAFYISYVPYDGSTPGGVALYYNRWRLLYAPHRTKIRIQL